MKKKESHLMDKMSNKGKGKLAALSSLHKMASDMMGSDLAGLKKVSVMAHDKKGLKEGLAKANELVDHEPDEDDRHEENSHLSQHVDPMEDHEDDEDEDNATNMYRKT